MILEIIFSTVILLYLILYICVYIERVVFYYRNRKGYSKYVSYLWFLPSNSYRMEVDYIVSKVYILKFI